MSSQRNTQAREYDSLRLSFAPAATRETRLQGVVDALWNAFGSRGYSWVGFYEIDPAGEAMILTHRQPKPACSPIGLHGCCGRSWKGRESLVVQDVAALGNGYIACDPRDRSEVVVPMFNTDGTCWGVLDVDSFDVGAFTDEDAVGLARLCERAGVSAWFEAPIRHI